jgi:hypothetical protein
MKLTSLITEGGVKSALNKPTDGHHANIRMTLDRNFDAKNAWYRLETDGWFRRYDNPGRGFGLMIRAFKISGRGKVQWKDTGYTILVSYLPNEFDNMDDDVPANYEKAKGFLYVDEKFSDLDPKDIEKFVQKRMKTYTP